MKKKPYICIMEQIKEKTSRLIEMEVSREDILKGMIVSFQLEGIKISEEAANKALEKVELMLKMQRL